MLCLYFRMMAFICFYVLHIAYNKLHKIWINRASVDVPRTKPFFNNNMVWNYVLWWDMKIDASSSGSWFYKADPNSFCNIKPFSPILQFQLVCPSSHLTFNASAQFKGAVDFFPQYKSVIRYLLCYYIIRLRCWQKCTAHIKPIFLSL